MLVSWLFHRDGRLCPPRDAAAQYSVFTGTRRLASAARPLLSRGCSCRRTAPTRSSIQVRTPLVDQAARELEADPLIFDWNRAEQQNPLGLKGLSLLDETLRDGLQNPSVVDPKIDDKLQILHLMDELGIEYADIGLPGAGQRQFDDVLRLAKEVVDRA